MPNKLTDAEVKKALECCSEPKGEHPCRECPLLYRDGSCTTLLVKSALDLINRQDAKIEQLEKQHIEDDKLLNDRVQEAVNAVSKANQKYVDSLEKAFNDRTAEKQNLEFENKELKAEVERLKDYNENLLTANTSLSNEILDVKAEAYKEFAERLKEKYTNRKLGQWNFEKAFIKQIDNLLNEFEIKTYKEGY